MTSSGRLAIWNRCVAGWEAEYERWYQGEHLEERLSVPGFLRGRRYVSVDRANDFFSYYETATPAVLTSAAYLARVNDPTPLTAKIMSNAFTDMSRTTCECLHVAGPYRGSFAATLLMDGAQDQAGLAGIASEVAARPEVARIEFWRAVTDDSPQSTEAALRGGDKRIDACVLAETLREADCLRVSAELAADLGAKTPAPQIYRLLCQLTA